MLGANAKNEVRINRHIDLFYMPILCKLFLFGHNDCETNEKDCHCMAMCMIRLQSLPKVGQW